MGELDTTDYRTIEISDAWKRLRPFWSEISSRGSEIFLYCSYVTSYNYCDRRVPPPPSPAGVGGSDDQDETLASAADGNDVGGVGGPAVVSDMSDEAT